MIAFVVLKRSFIAQAQNSVLTFTQSLVVVLMCNRKLVHRISDQIAFVEQESLRLVLSHPTALIIKQIQEFVFLAV